MGPGLATDGVPTPSPSVPVVPVVQPYGGFWIRFLAYFIDRLVVGAILSPLWIFFSLKMLAQLHQLNRFPPNGPEDLLPIFHYLGIIVPLAFLVQWLYEALLTSSTWQATVGKRVLNLKVTDEKGSRISFERATGRFFAKIISGLIMYIGFIMIAFTPRKQGLHDMIAGTLVMKVDPYRGF
jgi:uncharacterized RDD family membrane protein YckC